MWINRLWNQDQYDKIQEVDLSVLAPQDTIESVTEQIQWEVLNPGVYYFNAMFSWLTTSDYIPSWESLQDHLHSVYALSLSPSLQQRLYNEIIYAHPDLNRVLSWEKNVQGEFENAMIPFLLSLQWIHDISSVEEWIQALDDASDKANEFISSKWEVKEKITNVPSLPYPVRRILINKQNNSKISSLLLDNSEEIATYKMIINNTIYSRNDLILFLNIWGYLADNVVSSGTNDEDIVHACNLYIRENNFWNIDSSTLGTNLDKIQWLQLSIQQLNSLGTKRINNAIDLQLDTPSKPEQALLDAVLIQTKDIYKSLLIDSTSKSSSVEREAYHSLLWKITEYILSSYNNSDLLIWIEYHTLWESIITDNLIDADHTNFLLSDTRFSSQFVTAIITSDLSTEELQERYKKYMTYDSRWLRSEYIATPVQSLLTSQSNTQSLLWEDSVYNDDLYPQDNRPWLNRISNIWLNWYETKYSLGGSIYLQLKLRERTVDVLIQKLQSLEKWDGDYIQVQQFLDQIINELTSTTLPVTIKNSWYHLPILAKALPYVLNINDFSQSIAYNSHRRGLTTDHNRFLESMDRRWELIISQHKQHPQFKKIVEQLWPIDTLGPNPSWPIVEAQYYAFLAALQDDTRQTDTDKFIDTYQKNFDELIVYYADDFIIQHGAAINSYINSLPSGQIEAISQILWVSPQEVLALWGNTETITQMWWVFSTVRMIPYILGALGVWLWIWYMSGVSTLFKSEIQEITPMQRWKINQMLSIQTANVVFSDVDGVTFDYLDIIEIEYDDGTFTKLLKQAGEWFDEFLNITKDELRISVNGVMNASYDFKKHDIRDFVKYNEETWNRDTRLPAIDINSYIMWIDVDVVTQSIVSRLIPSSRKPEKRQELVGKVTEFIRQKALGNSSMIAILRRHSESSITDFLEQIISLATWKEEKINLVSSAEPNPISWVKNFWKEKESNTWWEKVFVLE